MALVEYSEDWSLTNAYLSEDSLHSLYNQALDRVYGGQRYEYELAIPLEIQLNPNRIVPSGRTQRVQASLQKEAV